MDYTENLNLAKPSRNTDDIADINIISENFQKIDDKVEVNSNKVQKLQPNDTSKDNYPSTYAVVSYAVPFSNVLREKTDNQKPNTVLYNANIIDKITSTHENSFCNALKGEKQGYQTVSIDDASPVKSDVFITLKNKNLCSIGSTGNFIGSKHFTFKDTLPAGVYTFSAVVNSTDTDNTSCLMLIYNGGTAIASVAIGRSADGERVSTTVTIKKAFDNVRLYAAATNANSSGDTASFTDIQIENGEVATNYVRHIDFEKEDVWVNVTTEKESYKITVKSGDNGKAVIKSQPTITLEAGTAFFISVEYNRDINKVMDEIFKKIENTSGGTLQTWFKAETDIQPSATIEQIEE